VDPPDADGGRGGSAPWSPEAGVGADAPGGSAFPCRSRSLPDAQRRRMTRSEIEQGVRALGDWFHNLDLYGVRTAPAHFLGDFPVTKWKRFAHVLPQDLTGKSVLDIGCNAGFYAFEMKKRSASRVVGIDFSDHYL